VELAAPPGGAGPSAPAAEAFFGSLGLRTVWSVDAPGLICGRIVAQLVNEAAFALEDGVGDAADIDAAMTLGLRFPDGPVAWGRPMGYPVVVAILDALARERGDQRYRVAPSLRRAAVTGRLAAPPAPGGIARSRPEPLRSAS
jgi:3-hydroxybutyryl-CoA dehydrogenase